jgi:3-mercaptopyruvate sulfurtransferase SseA
MAENRRNLTPWTIIGGGILLVLAGLAYVVLNQPAKPLVTPTPASVSQVQRVSLEDAKAAFDAKKAIFIDVRDSGSFNQAHILGAVLIPVSDLESRMDELDPKSWIIPYCT